MSIDLSSAFSAPSEAPPFTSLIASGPRISFQKIPATPKTPAIYYHSGPLSSQTALLTFLTIWHYPTKIQELLKARTDQIVCAFSPLSGRTSDQIKMIPSAAGIEEVAGNAHVSNRTIEICSASYNMALEILGNPDQHQLHADTAAQDMADLLAMIRSPDDQSLEMALLYLHRIHDSSHAYAALVTSHEAGHMLRQDVMTELFKVHPNTPCPYAPPDAEDVFSEMVIRETEAFLMRKYAGQFDYFHKPEEATAELIGISLSHSICTNIESIMPGIGIDLNDTRLDRVMPRSFHRVDSAIHRLCCHPHEARTLSNSAAPNTSIPAFK